MTRVRSPLALVASLACLSSAAIMAMGLVGQPPAATSLDGVRAGEEVAVQGELEPWTQEGWEQVHEQLWDTTYVLEIPGVQDVVLLTGMAAGLEHQPLSATAVVLLQIPHPERPIDILVLAPSTR